MSGGLFAVIGGGIILFLMWLCGHIAGKNSNNTKVTKLQGEVTVLQAENNAVKVQADLQKEVSHIAVESAKENAQAQADYQTAMNQLEAARRTSNMDMALAIGQQLAQKMLERGATSK